MAGFEERRLSHRYSIRIPDAVRIDTDSGSCVADLIDICERGMGVEYFDLLNFLELTPNDVVKVEFLANIDDIVEPEVRKILKVLETHWIGSLEGSSSEEKRDELKMTIPAKVVWVHLNRLGVQFLLP